MVDVIDEEQKTVRFTKEDLFDALKGDNPTAFGTKEFEDVETISDDANDTSFIAVIFKKEDI